MNEVRHQLINWYLLTTSAASGEDIEYHYSNELTMLENIVNKLLAEQRKACRDQWAPIETAPKTADWILLGYYPDYMEGECQGGHAEIAYWNGNTWINSCGNKLNKEGAFSPTHWCPRPSPPTQLEKSDE